MFRNFGLVALLSLAVAAPAAAQTPDPEAPGGPSAACVAAQKAETQAGKELRKAQAKKAQSRRQRGNSKAAKDVRKAQAAKQKAEAARKAACAGA